MNRSDLYRVYPTNLDIAAILDEITHLPPEFQPSAQRKQVSLMTTQATLNETAEVRSLLGTGTATSFVLTGVRENDFNIIQPELAGTYIESILKGMKNIHRVRFMLVQPYNCYSIHRDIGYRFHIPLVNDGSGVFIFAEDEVLVPMPATGETYVLNVNRSHTAINASTQLRLHIVGCIKEWLE